MNSNRKRRINQIDEDTLIVGIDIAKNKHAVRAQDFRGIEYGKAKYFVNRDHDFERIKRWILSLAKKASKEDIVIGIEPTGHYWLPLYKYFTASGFKVVTVNPYHVEKSKELDDNNPTKCDKKDALVIAQLVKDGRYSTPNLPEGKYAELRVAINHRERLMKNLNGIKNRIIRWLDIYFPEFNNVFKNWERKAAISTLKNLPLPEKIIPKEVKEIVNIWREDGIKRGVGKKRAKKLKKYAQSSIGLQTGKKMAELELKNLLKQYEQLNKQLENLEEKIEKILKEIPGAEEMISIPGVGSMTVAGFLSECGNLDDYNHPKQIIKLAGLNLMEHSSGKHKGETRISKRGRPQLRSLLYRVSMPLVRHNDEFSQIHEYYKNRSRNPLEKKQSLIAICCKLIKILFTLGTREIEYDGEKMLDDIKRPTAYKKAV